MYSQALGRYVHEKRARHLRGAVRIKYSAVERQTCTCIARRSLDVIRWIWTLWGRV